MPTLSAAPELSPAGGRTEQRHKVIATSTATSTIASVSTTAPSASSSSEIRNAAATATMSPEQEASPPPAAPGASPSPPPSTTLPSPAISQSQEEQHGGGNSDVEQFSGKIVYNPDGSAYIIEDSESESESASVNVPEVVPPLQAVYVSRLLRQATRQPAEQPAVHSYRVIALRDARPPRPTSVPVKPILMCFVCKLSFGFARSFANHAQSEHGVHLQDAEREILSADCSAILQCVGADKKPIVSLLEPFGTSSSQQVSDNHMCSVPVPVSRSEQMSPSSEITPVSSRNTPGKSPSPPFAPPPAFLSGTTIGVCPEHLQGRPSGVDCPRCEMILASGRLGPAGLGNVHSRNSCKTLKCPKCNWHYKYQETLEIHMKEKHPETETSCIYCIAGQPHPRLARGETYTCGYKPYRCEVCNYSTTTKGNLSIHMQSDKHLNNMQELQNGGAPNTESRQASPKAPSLHHSPVSSGHKPKPSFRCDVCNYETNVARNLRIHMTSEKHTHNMLVLQQNVKHMQTLSAIHHQQQSQHMENLYGIYPGLGDKPEAALADMAYNQALLIQMMTGGQLPGHAGPADMTSHSDLGLNPETMEPPPEPAELDPQKTFHCCVCNLFSTDSLEDLGRHLAQDRTRLREQEILAVIAGHYVCKLCTYKTNLKANFQLHCKTDKHLQRLQHVNHVKEGGLRNEWKLKYASAPGGVQIRCNACDYYTNSAHKLQLHSAGSRHEAGVALLRFLEERSSPLRPDQPRVFHCNLCGFSAANRLPLLQHIKSLKHLHLEQLHQIQRRAEGKDAPAEMSEVFQVVPAPFEQRQQRTPERRDSTNSSDLKQEQSNESLKTEPLEDVEELNASQTTESDSPVQMCPYCNYTSDSEMRIQAHIIAQHSENSSSSEVVVYHCPLCQDQFKDRPVLERHVMQIHSVNSEGLQRLLMLVDQSHWLNQVSRTSTPNQTGNNQIQTPPNQMISPNSVASKDSNKLDKGDVNMDDVQEVLSPNSDENTDPEVEKCGTCSKNFKNIDELCCHQNETGHLEIKQTPSGPGYMCWKKGCNQFFPTAHTLQMHFREVHAKNSITQMSVSEKHVYKYRCNQCSLAFKTLEKLQLHSQYHLIRDATKCVLCGRSFRSVVALHKHVESVHSELTDEELIAYKQSLMNNPLLLAGLQGQVLDSSTNDILRKESLRNDEIEPLDCDDSKELNTSQEDNNQNDGENSDDSIVYKDQQFLEDYLNSQAMAEDSYNDPNRKYKCHRCKVAFTRQNYLTAHNKTLLHRKGEKLSYPMEKYLDPNRPYKCDVCKESFTQKNILLVHYNSVSHLHKLKRAMQEQQQQNNNNNQPVSPIISSQTQNLSLTPKSTSSDEDDKKRYKCNICKVAYTQGSTLDIHMRSVLHQTRASKLQDLALSGQIDLSKPLIEQPEAMQSPHQTSPAPCIGGSGGEKLSPTPPSPGTGSQQQQQQGMMSCSKCGALFASTDQLCTHQQQCCTNTFAAPMAIFQASQEPGQAKSPPPPSMSSEGQHQQELLNRLNLPKKSGSYMYKQLLESFGFDLVMQYNESHQRRQRQLNEEKQLSSSGSCISPPSSSSIHGDVVAIEPTAAAGAKSEEEPSTDNNASGLPEFKTEYEKKSVVVTAATSSTTHVPTTTSVGGEDPDPEKDGDDNIKESTTTTSTIPSAEAGAVTTTAPSTPTSSTTPSASSTDSASVPSNIQAIIAQSMAQNPMALAQQMSEMQAALNVMQLQQQLNFNPMMQMMGMGLPLGLNALAAMNLQPPLVPLMMPPPPYDPISQFAPQDQQAMLAKQQVMMQQQVAVSAAANQKRARTRITDEQLKILRSHFDINNSPSEEQIQEMAIQSGLPPKVIKHWFRNTLFKERQRNKDSPYNFNNPPSTTLNLEEYEKTGEAKVMPLNSSGSSTDDGGKQDNLQQPTQIKMEVKEEPAEDIHKYMDEKLHHSNEYEDKTHIFNLPPHSQSPISYVTTSDPQNYTQTSNSQNSFNLTSVIASQFSDVITTTSAPLSITPNTSTSTSPMLPPTKMNQSNFSTPNSFQNILPLSGNRCLSPNRGDYNPGGSVCSAGSSTGKRANRTRFTDYQIKVLQEFFENNAYPKDDDLEYLSKLLNLSPRVIVVWFQNARQKARKVYENQPAIEPSPGITTDEAGANRFQRTPGLNYQCKKCLLVFQRYYELIRHQKTHCFKEEDAKRSAQAQAAAAQIAAVLSSEDSNSSTIVEQSQQQQQQQQPQQQQQQQQQQQPPPPPQQQQHNQQQSSLPMTSQSQNNPHSPMQTTNIPITPNNSGSNFPTSPTSTPQPPDCKEGSFQCDKCNLVFPRFDLWREHQIVHIMNPNLFPSYPPDSPFGILQQHAQLQQLNAANINDLNNTASALQHPIMNMINSVVGQKRKFDEDSESDVSDQPKDKRLRTTILPEQLDYLYQKYQIESNPSRKMLENIAREVGLKKRVVQVWFQNTRARERKGQFRAHAQVINKRCPFCPALFKVKSALESHLTAKHSDQCARGEINIDAIPDEEVSLESSPNFNPNVDTKSQQSQNAAIMPQLFPPLNSDIENSIKKYYEESMKRYISELQAHATASTNGDRSEVKTGKEETGETPLDLSKPVDLSRPMKVNMDHERSMCDPGPLTDLSERSLCDERSDSMSETTEFFDDESNPTSPASSTQSNQQQRQHQNNSASKRFRTQMSSLQVKVMKSLFSDYKTPTMAECEMLGREIGLPKRVVQVWFQNARAKEKKNKLALQKVLGGSDVDTTKTPEECRVCSFKYSHKFSIQDHIFTKGHIANVRLHLENTSKDGSGSDGEFTVPPIPGVSGNVPADSTTNVAPSSQNVNNNSHMQLLQMASMQMAAASKGEKDSQESLFQQLYSLGSNNSYSMQNQLLQTSLFGTNGGPGGLLLDTGTGPSFLPLPPPVLEQVAAGNLEPGVTTLRMNETSPRPMMDLPAREIDLEVCFVCKKCRLAFPVESHLINHQRQCYSGNLDNRGVFRIVQTGFECKNCPQERFKTLQGFWKHAETSCPQKFKLSGISSSSSLPPPSESPLSHEMEDVVNQITLLAARAAAQESTPDSNRSGLDSNSNAFCQPPDPKRRFLTPGDVAQQPLTSAGH
ncbi:zinc finger homeobox protein 4 isoform X2 [Agrilus planipennis]|uniref:Zinc finger homeobox protein 4 isoform X2 n=1 Tax=Agrilus planipennis TaxID=224129 RepID=A0A1W4X905_AGRPL|nr:zinc finger homeobox protein 4 isoform X2 [Agrilus planipennis]